jgi:hypothetical protein
MVLPQMSAVGLDEGARHQPGEEVGSQPYRSVGSTSAMIWHEEYRGFQVSYQSGDRVAWIKPRLSALALVDRPEVQQGEGRVELRAKAHMAIDAEISALAGLPGDLHET